MLMSDQHKHGARIRRCELITDNRWPIANDNV